MANTALGLAVTGGRAFSPWASMVVLFSAAVACRSPTSVVEAGAVLLDVKCAQASPIPDELRIWAWDDSGEIWDNVRMPSSGPLVRANSRDLGTILVHPDSIRGALRIHVRGLAQAVRVADGVVRIDSVTDGSRIFEVLLDTPAIDDCPFVPKLDQTACSGGSSSDAASTGGAGGGGGSGAGTGAGGVTGTGGSSVAGGTGALDAGNITSTGGTASATGGTTSAGGKDGGGALSSGGSTTSGADSGLGGRVAAGGATAVGGTSAAGGVTASGGTSAAGGATASGGGSAGAKGSGGSTGKATSPPTPALPGAACTTESADAACHPAGVFCYKYCGPESQGYKVLSCAGGKYVEGLCTFSSSVDYRCYAVSSVAACAAAPPTAGTACSIEDCKTCGSSSGTGYYDGTKTAKIGYCVCSEGKWSCASVGAWPCPGRTGC